MSRLKRISMAGSDVAVTEASIADLVLEYAMHLGRVGTTDIVAVPVHGEHGDLEVDLLVGPSSQIVLSDSEEIQSLDRPRVDEVTADLRARIERVTGRSAATIADDDGADPLGAFVDYDEYGDEGLSR
jgi:hypothetical protein